ncbi:hypothetical protein C1645_795518 [Glomus cerebriforme]|uniref:Uncharacterized protein n=1 Tax=Glomus cerebriforme TaxID=658196 RepID=A0A397RWE9_9GLOM|nr:hypothetical protein C1645_795518 [Glomus cerebriforme]
MGYGPVDDKNKKRRTKTNVEGTTNREEPEVITPQKRTKYTTSEISSLKTKEEPDSEINRGRGKRGKRKIIDFDVEFVEPNKVSEKPKKRPRRAGVNVKSYVELSDEDDEDNEDNEE